MISRVTSMLIAICFVLALAAPGWGQQIIPGRIRTEEPDVFRPVTPEERNKITIEEQKADISVKNQAATVSIEQIFRSTFQNVAEGTFIFPIPDGAALSQFSMWMGGEEIQGQILEAGEARRVYEGIVSQMRDPGLLEYVGTKMFKARVFPIPANGEMKVKLTYQQMLEAESGLVTLTYPLNCAKFTRDPLKRVLVDVRIEDETGVRTVFSPSHGSALAVSKLDDNHARASFEQSNYLPDRDLLLYYSRTDEAFGLNMVCHRSMGNDGYFTMMISPRTDIKQEDIVPKDVVFVLDTSGSMKEEGGLKLRQAKQALAACIGSLNDGDRFNVISFNMDVRKFKDTLIDVNQDSRAWGAQFVDGLDAGGGTNINEALLQSMALQDNPSRLFMICFITDGTPTIGVRDESEILKNLKAANTGNSRIFVFGVGADLNAVLLDKIAECSRGARTYVNAGDDMETRISEFSAKVANPVLTNPVLSLDGVEAYSMYPSTLGDLFKGSQIIVTGRYKGEGAHLIKLSGDVNGRRVEHTYEATFRKDEIGNDHVPLLWATKRVGALLEEIRFHGSNEELVKEVTALGKEFGIVTPYTSYLVVEDSELQNWNGRRDEIRRRAATADPGEAFPQSLRRDLEGDAPRPEAIQEANDAMDEENSVDGIELSKAVDALKSAEASHGFAGGGTFAGRLGGDRGTEAVRLSIRRAADKTFYLRSGVYVDGEVDKADLENIVKVRFMSDEYLALLSAGPNAPKYLSVDTFLVVKLSGKTYFIYDGPEAEEGE